MELNANEWLLVKTAVDAMVDTLPDGDNVPDEDRVDATRDKKEYVDLQAKLATF